MNQTAETIQGIRTVYSVGNLAFVLVGLVGYFIYAGVPQSKMAEIRAALKARKAENAPKVEAEKAAA